MPELLRKLRDVACRVRSDRWSSLGRGPNDVPRPNRTSRDCVFVQVGWVTDEIGACTAPTWDLPWIPDAYTNTPLSRDAGWLTGLADSRNFACYREGAGQMPSSSIRIAPFGMSMHPEQDRSSCAQGRAVRPLRVCARYSVRLHVASDGRRRVPCVRVLQHQQARLHLGRDRPTGTASSNESSSTHIPAKQPLEMNFQP
jgi:hypothetical protein